MSKKNKANRSNSIAEQVQAVEAKMPNQEVQTNDASIFSKITSGWIPYILIAVIGFALYANTFHHEFALDDELVVCRNDNVSKGIAGIGDIFHNDIFDSYNKQINAEANMAGGRYRPFALATYAVEQEFIGTNPTGYKPNSWDINKNIKGDPEEDINKDGLYNDSDVFVKGMTLRHIDNVLLYILSVCVLFFFLSAYFFKDKPLLALLISILFLVHPIHTEVVANVKSRDEILSLMFMVLTLYFSFKYYEVKKMKELLLACACYFIALLSKEYGVSLLIIIPIAMYVYFKQLKFSEIRMLLIGLGVSFIIYYALRSSVVLDLSETARQDQELLNNPFLYAKGMEAFATKIFINLKYFGLLLFPYKLSCDYSYNVIPFRSMADIGVLFTLLVLIAMGVAILVSIRKRLWFAFPLLFIMIHLFLINNFFFNIGATMGERLVYHSSLGICILVVYGIYYLVTEVFKQKIALVAILLFPLIILGSYKTISRNPAWKNNIALYTTDVKTYPNSTMLNGNACLSCFEMSNMPNNADRINGLLDTATNYGLKALQMHPGYYFTDINLGLVKNKQGKKDSAIYYWLKAKQIAPNEPSVNPLLDQMAGEYYNQGQGFFNQNNFSEALVYFLKSNKVSPKDYRPLYFIGLTYSKLGDMKKAKAAWVEGLSYAPNDATLQNAVNSVANE